MSDLELIGLRRRVAKLEARCLFLEERLRDINEYNQCGPKDKDIERVLIAAFPVETTVKPICATCDDWHDSGYYNHNFVPKPETAGKPSRMCPECHAVGGPDGVTICATCVSGWWEQGCEHCGSLEINPKCPACNGIER